MPCYMPWDAWYDASTADFAERKATYEPLWKRFQHVIDFYYAVEDMLVPRPESYRELPPELGDGWYSDTPAEPRSLHTAVFGSDDAVRRVHKRVIHRVALHLACDGAGAADAWDVAIWLRHEASQTRDPRFIGYGHIVAWLGLGLRNGTLLGNDRPSPWKRPTNVPDARVRNERFKTTAYGTWRDEPR